MTVRSNLRELAAVAFLAAALAMGAGGPASSQSAAPAAAPGQPVSVNPTASSVNEQKLLEALKPEAGKTAAVSGRVSIPDGRSGNLIQPAGRDWRDSQGSSLPKVGIVAVIGMLGLLTLFYLLRGRVKLSKGFSGLTMVRFGGIERFAHWLTAVSFIVLGLTGLNLTFGKSIVLPLVGPEKFTMLTQAGKFAHNYVSFAFAAGLVLMFVLWIKDNFPHPRDLLWIVQGGGLFGKFHPAAGRFNFGQKLIFWAVILGGTGLAVTGYVLMFPFRFTDIAGMQQAAILHGLIGVVLIAVILAHVYIGTLGMQGAFSAMGSGKVDVNWAREHHSVWVERVEQRNPGAVPKAPGVVPAE